MNIWQKWLEHVGVATLDLLVLSLLFPLHAGTLAVAVLLLGLGAFSWLTGRRGRAALAAIAALALLALAPFVIYQRPIYFASSQRINPLEASATPLAPDGSVAGTVVRLADPLRPYLARRLAARLPDRFLWIGSARIGSQRYLLMPLKAALVQEEPWLSEKVVKRTVRLPVLANGVVYELEVEGYDAGGLSFNVAGRIGSGGLTISYTSLADLPPWRAVVADAPTLDALRYVALVDQALLAASRAETVAGFLALEEALTVAAPSERGRLFALLGHFSHALLSGNVGGLQSLGFYNAAFQALRDGALRSPGSARTPVENWLLAELLQVYRRNRRAYGERFALLQAEAERAENVVSGGRPDRDTLRQRIVGLLAEGRLPDALEVISAADLLSASKEPADPFLAESRKLARASLPELEAAAAEAARGDVAAKRRFVAAALGEPLSRMTRARQSAVLEEAIRGEARPTDGEDAAKVAAIRAVAERLPAGWRDAYLQRLDAFDHFGRNLDELQRILRDRDTGADPGRLFSRALFEFAGVPEPVITLIDVTRQQRQPDPHFEIPLHRHESADWPWWSDEYQAFFATQFVNFFRMLADREEQGDVALADYLDVDELTRDRDGHGSQFLPGTALAVIAARFAGEEIDGALARAVEQQIGARFDDLGIGPPRPEPRAEDGIADSPR